MKLINTIVLGLLLPLFSFAGGGQLGNGADAVVCTTGYKTTAELLDIYEARVLLGKNWVPGYRGGTDIEISTYIGVNKILAQLDTKLPAKSARLRSYVATFFEESNFLYGVELTDIPDSLQVALPGGCKLAQLVIQSPNPQLGQKRYTINGDIWNLMDPTSRMGMVLHEVIYRDQLILGHKDSRWTRYLNALFFSNSIENLSPKDINDVIKKGAYESFTRHGVELLGPVSTDQDIYQIVSAAPSSGLPANIVDGRYSLNQDRVLDYTTTAHGDVLGISTDATYGVELNANLQPAKAYMLSGKLSDDIYLYNKTNNDFEYKAFIIEGLDQNGNIIAPNNRPLAGIKFKNGVIIGTWSLKGLKTRATSEDWLQAQGCTTDECTITSSKFNFANGNGVLTNDFTIRHAGGEIVDVKAAKSSIEFKIRIPPGVDPAVIKNLYRFEPMLISFKSVGGFSFDAVYGYRSSYNLVFKDGTVTKTIPGKAYHFEFDMDGYLLSATPISTSGELSAKR